LVLTYAERVAIAEHYAEEIEESIMEGMYEDSEPPIDPTVLLLQAIEMAEMQVIERINLRNYN
jgi:hypothetical protein